MHSAGKPVWQQLTALVSLGASGAVTGFTFTPVSRDGPPGSYGTWTLRAPGPGPDLIVALDPITTAPCDHRHMDGRSAP